MFSSFKIGDKIRVKDKQDYRYGATGLIAQVQKNFIWVEMNDYYYIDPIKGNIKYCFWFTDRQIEKID